MSERRRNSSAGKSALQALKDLPPEARAALMQERKDGATVEVVLQTIAKRHGISGLDARRWSDFARWQEQRQFWETASDNVETLRETLAVQIPEATDDAVHKYLVDLVKSILATADDPQLQANLLKFAVVETRKRMELTQSARKIELLEKQAAEAVAASEDPQLTAEEKAQRIREIFKR